MKSKSDVSQHAGHARVAGRPNARKQLRGLSRRSLDFPDAQARFMKLRDETDQAIALVGAAMVDDALKRAITRTMRDLSKEELSRLFENTGPLATFASRIAVAYAIEVIRPKFRDDLERVRDIRNVFAHAVVDVTFVTPEVLEVCASLHMPETVAAVAGWSFDQAKDRYLVTVWNLWSRLGVWASLEYTESLSRKAFGGSRTRRAEIEYA